MFNVAHKSGAGSCKFLKRTDESWEKGRRVKRRFVILIRNKDYTILFAFSADITLDIVEKILPLPLCKRFANLFRFISIILSFLIKFLPKDF